MTKNNYLVVFGHDLEKILGAPGGREEVWPMAIGRILNVKKPSGGRRLFSLTAAMFSQEQSRFRRPRFGRFRPAASSLYVCVSQFRGSKIGQVRPTNAFL